MSHLLTALSCEVSCWTYTPREIPCLAHSFKLVYLYFNGIKFVLWGKFIFWCLCCRLKLIPTHSSMIYHFFCVSLSNNTIKTQRDEKVGWNHLTWHSFYCTISTIKLCCCFLLLFSETRQASFLIIQMMMKVDPLQYLKRKILLRSVPSWTVFL